MISSTRYCFHIFFLLLNFTFCVGRAKDQKSRQFDSWYPINNDKYAEKIWNWSSSVELCYGYLNIWNFELKHWNYTSVVHVKTQCCLKTSKRKRMHGFYYILMLKSTVNWKHWWKSWLCVSNLICIIFFLYLSAWYAVKIHFYCELVR